MSERPSDGLMQWAAVGSRISGFHHDSASKLQSLMMALDEATELLGDGSPEAAASLSIAMTSLRELHGLLTENRALAKTPARKQVPISELLKRAAARHSLKLEGELPADTVHVALPSMVHALALLSEAISGPPQGARTVQVEVRPGDGRVAITISGTPPAQSALDAITIATWLVEREDGAVFSSPSGFQIHLPTSAPSAGAKP